MSWDAVVRLPSFEEDLGKYPIDQTKLDKWIEDLHKAPTQIKNAHALQGIEKPLWSAHFNGGNTTYVVKYALCNANPEQCFSLRGIESHLASAYMPLVQHTCDKEHGKVYLLRIGTHSIYKG